MKAQMFIAQAAITITPRYCTILADLRVGGENGFAVNCVAANQRLTLLGHQPVLKRKSRLIGNIRVVSWIDRQVSVLVLQCAIKVVLDFRPVCRLVKMD